MSGKGKREEPSIRIRDESLTSLGFRTLVSLGFSKTECKMSKFQSFILSSQHMQYNQCFPRHVLLGQFSNMVFAASVYSKVCSIIQKGNGKS